MNDDQPLPTPRVRARRPVTCRVCGFTSATAREMAEHVGETHGTDDLGDLLAALDESPEEAVRQVIANGRIDGAPDPTPEEYDQLLAVARGEQTADEVIAEMSDPDRRAR